MRRRPRTPGADAVAHEPVTQAAAGSPIPITVTVDASLGAKKVVVAYRPDGAAEFIEHELAEASPGNWSGQIPAVATSSGVRVAYYVEVQNEAGDAITAKGSEKQPFVVILKGGRALPPKRPPPPEPEDESTRWFFGLAVGSGIGWATGTGEVNPQDKISPPGFAAAAVGHVAPEIGYFVKPDQLLLSVQLRLQYITGTTVGPGSISDCGMDMLCDPAKTAVAGFVRLTWLWGDDNLHPYLAAVVGGGNIRHIATFKGEPTCGVGGDQICVDTIPSGPVFAGPAGGFIYDLTSSWALTLGVNTLFGFPKFTFNVDVNGGVALRL
jgi:hypothetical protein